jgi:hypothetical protein
MLWRISLWDFYHRLLAHLDRWDLPVVGILMPAVGA